MQHATQCVDDNTHGQGGSRPIQPAFQLMSNFRKQVGLSYQGRVNRKKQ